MSGRTIEELWALHKDVGYSGMWGATTAEEYARWLPEGQKRWAEETARLVEEKR